MAEPFRLRPMDMRDILDETFDLYKENFVLFVTVSAILLLPFQVVINLIVGGAFMPMTANPSSPPNPAEFLRALPTFGATTFLATIVYYIVIGALTRAVSERYLGHKITVRNAYDAILTRVGSFIGTLLRTLLAVVAGEILLFGVTFAVGAALAVASPVAGALSLIVLVPAVLLAAMVYWSLFMFVIPVFVVEGRRGGNAVSRSVRLVFFSPMKVFFTLFLILVIVWLLTAILVTPLSLVALVVAKNPPLYFLFRAVQGAFNGLVQALIQPIMMIVVLLLYYDVRIRKEGFDLEMMAVELKASSTASSDGPPSLAIPAAPETAGPSSQESTTAPDDVTCGEPEAVSPDE